MNTYNIFRFFIVVVVFSCSLVAKSQTGAYYFNALSGNDINEGTSPLKAWRSLVKIKDITLKPGDRILLAANQSFKGSLNIIDASGSKELPILIATYGNKEKPFAKIQGKGQHQALLIRNTSFIEVKNLWLTASKKENKPVTASKDMRCGLLVEVTKPKIYEHIYLTQLKVANVFFENKGFVRPQEEVKTANGTQNYGWGIRFINNTEGGLLRDIKLDSSIIENVGHTGIKFTARNKNHQHAIIDFQISNTKVSRTGGPGIQMSGVKNGHVFNNIVAYSGSNNDTRKWGRGSGLWTWGSSDVLIEKNRFTDANGPGDSAGAHIDYNCNNIVLQYNFSANNAGGFCEILGNNYNCSYRYNISVNDGYRVKGENGAFQEGKIFWLSAFAGNTRKGPYNSYFYNNTIYVKEAIQTKIAIDRLAKGVLIANNIFYIKGNSKQVKGDQYLPQKNGKGLAKQVVFENNLFLHSASWPKEMPLQGTKSVVGDAKFVNPGGLYPVDYTPTNRQLIKNKGIVIPNITNDTIGIVYGLLLMKDILGNPLVGLPDLGAIEIK